MASVITKLSVGLPDDKDSDKLRLYESATSGGEYSLLSTHDYSYGQEVVESVTIDTTKYYKVAFYNSSTAVEGNLSNYVLGSVWQDGYPNFNITSLSDGNPRATYTDVLALTPHAGGDVPSATITAFLRASAARVNMIMGDISYDRYARLYESDIAKRKYNAQLEIMKMAEIYFTLSLMHTYLADEVDESQLDGTDPGNISESISIGMTSISNTSKKGTSESDSKIFKEHADGYEKRALDLLSTILPNGIPVVYSETTVGYSKFLDPTTGLRHRI